MPRNTPPTRRQFLSTSLGAAIGVPALAGLESPATDRVPAPPPSRRTEKILILGGTGFLGPAIVEAALARGHELTLFNRGRTNPKLFPEVEKLRGNRRRPAHDGDPEQDLTALAGREWDAVIDTSGYFTKNVEDSAQLLKDAVGQYVFVSSISVYSEFGKTTKDITEASPVGELDDRYVLQITEETYGPLKAYCEQAVEAALPGRATLVRPGYIVGPRDRSDRFTYWPMRFARGGEILAPGDPNAELQIIDVRDLGAWIVLAVERHAVGPFNTVGYKGRISTEEFLHCGKCVFDDQTTFTWVSDEFLKKNGVTSWGEMPAWTPQDEYNHTDCSRAIANGLTFRPIAETIRDTWEWASKERPKDRSWRAGMKPEREQELLAAWHAAK